MKIVSTNPAKDYQVIGEVEVTSSQEITAKIAAAQSTKNDWKLLGVERRIELIRPIQKELLERKQEIAGNSSRLRWANQYHKAYLK